MVVVVTLGLVLALGVGLYYDPIFSLAVLGYLFFITAKDFKDKKGIIPTRIIKILASCYFIPLVIIFLCKVFAQTNDEKVAVILSGVISYAIAIPLALWVCIEHSNREVELEKNIAHYGYWQFVRLGKTVETRAENQYILKMITKGHLIIDTCVWMAGEEFDCFYEDLLDVLKENGGKITISADILDELARLKSNSDTKKRAGARRGLTRIEKFQNDGLIKTCGVKKVANPKAYADKSIIEFFLKSDNSTLLTFDRDLKIRLIALLEEQKLTNSRQILTIKPITYDKD